MNADLTDAAISLVQVLAQENDALRTLDLRHAASLTDAKARAIEAFSRAQSKQERRPTPLTPAQRTAIEEMAARLRDLVVENRRLLERAIGVQQRVIGVVARAAPHAIAAQNGRYGADGTLTARRKMPAVALSARA
jgi:flagellar biosynthesis/type III secretory pathway chaperone|uniref:Flagellar protein FlgN n=1 Tax=Acidicaldus sp. TaxID=1872105 RepID=A0A8J4M662_9PROT